MAIEDYYTTLERRRTEQAVDAYGDVVQSADAEPYVFAGVIVPLSQAQATAAAQRGVDIDGTLFAELAAGIKPFDIITDAEHSYQVVDEPVDTMSRHHHVEAGVRKMRGVHE